MATLDLLGTVFKALADPTRLRILALLSRGETCVCDIQAALRIPQPKTSRHLAYLRNAGLVSDRRDGLWVHYKLATPADPVVRSVLAEVGHALGHLDTTARDRRRLNEEPPACCPEPTGVRACCGGG
jgi:ArsR family transcriptional regulator